MLGSPDRELALPASPAPHGVLANLRRALALEFPQITADKSALAFGIPSLDAALGGGLATGALHEIAAAREAEIPAATGFALILAARNRGPVVWIAEDMALAENGAPYGAGLEDLGLAPERLIAVRAAKSRDVLWAMEEALAGAGGPGGPGGPGAVIGEIRTGIDFLATRRLSFAAGRGRALALLLRSAPANEPSAAATRFLVGAAPSRPPSGAIPMACGPGPPRFCVRLTRNRRGPLGAWMLEFDRVEQRCNAPADREPVAETALDRPRQALTLPPNSGVPGFGNHESVDIGNIRCRPRGRVAAEGGGVG
ncbi:MAG: DNA repair protein [Alphaproteobacteria bacterium]|nr:MAG: DNA repair protein [Alphaproteobacteria bacterium]